jgi:type VI secretion system VasD/TssJ family lipoprotein
MMIKFKSNRIMLLLAISLLLSGCLQTKKNEGITFLIRTTKTTNKGTPLYVLLKETSMAQFLTQDYHEIAAQTSWKEGDESNLVKKVLVPGTTNKITLPLPGKDKSVGVYFLFTNPGESWKYILDKPKAEKVKILLGEREYKSVNVFE